MSEKSGWGSKLDMGAVKKVLDYLFGKDGGSQFLDMRTEVSDREFFSTLTYYRLLEEEYSCKAAGAVANILERLAVSNKRMGRLEGVTILKQQLPKEEVLLKGLADSIKESMGGET